MKKSEPTFVNANDLKPALENLLSLAKQHGADACDALASHGRSLSIGVREGKLEDIDNSEGKDVGLRVFIGQRQACVSSSDLSKDSLSKLAERAVAMARLAPEDPYCGLADKDRLAKNTPELDAFDSKTLEASDLFERAKQVESAALSHDSIQQAEGASASAVSTASYFMTSGGFSNGWRATHHGISVSAIAARGEAMERDYDYAGTRHFADLPSPQTVGNKAAQRAQSRLGAKQMPSGTMPVLFERRVASQLLSAFLNAISGSAITRGVSFLKDDMDAQVFANTITITDDPLRLRGMGSRPWDGEGVNGKVINLVEDGILKTWLLHSASARQLELETTGHATRGLSSPPGVSSSNTHMHAGEKSVTQLLKDMNSGLSITEMFGPSINPNTGDFSVGIAGFAIENGEYTYPVSEITVAGNLKDMFKSIIPANDLHFKHAVNTPSFIIDNMVIAGE